MRYIEIVKYRRNKVYGMIKLKEIDLNLDRID